MTEKIIDEVMGLVLDACNSKSQLDWCKQNAECTKEAESDLASELEAIRAKLREVLERKPLTNEQIDDLHGEANRGFDIESDAYFKAFRDAERVHGIGS